jgi:small GTP-binding protein
MFRPRLFILLVGLVVILGLMLWLVTSLQRLYWQIAWTSPFLANLLLLVFMVLLIVLIGALVYYGWIFRHPGRSRQPQPRSRSQAPTKKTDAVAANLQAVRQQVAQIQDQVARQALLERSAEIETSLSDRPLQVVVFGTGSAGKTSLVNALIGRMAGEVGATMGTTEIGETYRVHLQGLETAFWITDTPGLLEPGVAGTEREQAARKLATEADLLLFVIESDLTQSEYQPLEALGQMGKRSLLVLNKIDRYPQRDVDTLLTHLRQRVQPWMKPEDVVAIAAHPQPLPWPKAGRRPSVSGEWIYPEPDLGGLLRRMIVVLRQEGAELLADNLLLQSQRLGETARDLIDQQRRQQADKLVQRFQWLGAGAIWVSPIPVIDLLATAAVNAQMVVELAKIYGCELTMAQGRELAVSLAKTLGSLGIVKGALQVFSRALQLSVAGYVLGKTIQSISAAYLTRIAGKSFIEYFRNDQDWGDGGMAEVVQRQFQLNRRDDFIKAFIKEAITQLPEGFALALKPWSEGKRSVNVIEVEAEREEA